MYVERPWHNVAIYSLFIAKFEFVSVGIGKVTSRTVGEKRKLMVQAFPKRRFGDYRNTYHLRKIQYFCGRHIECYSQTE